MRYGRWVGFHVTRSFSLALVLGGVIQTRLSERSAALDTRSAGPAVVFPSVVTLPRLCPVNAEPVAYLGDISLGHVDERRLDAVPTLREATFVPYVHEMIEG